MKRIYFYLTIIITTLFSFFGKASIVSAHEAYVLPTQYFWQELHTPFSGHAFDALRNGQNIKITLTIIVAVFIALILNFFFRRTLLGQRIHAFPEKFRTWGPHFVRITIGIACIFSALSGSFLGPELSLTAMPFAHILPFVLGGIGILLLLGLFTEIAAVIALVIFIMSFGVFGPYMMTYANYLGEFLILLLFGMRIFSLDRYIFGPLRRFKNFEKYETLIIRVFYGAALIFAAITVKLLHPELTVHVVEQWNLTQFHWLFPSDPLLVTLGAGIVETVIGIFIIFGFEMRLTVLVSLFYITLSLLFFRERVWPHLLLYGISFNLLVQPETFTLDHIFFEEHRKKHPWWKRPFLPHHRGKSTEHEERKKESS